MFHVPHTSLLQNSLQIKLQQPNVIAKRNTKITRNRVKRPFVGVFRGGNGVQVLQNNPQQARFCNGFCKRLACEVMGGERPSLCVRSMFAFYACMGSGNPFSMQLNAYSSFLETCKIPDNDSKVRTFLYYVEYSNGLTIKSNDKCQRKRANSHAGFFLASDSCGFASVLDGATLPVCASPCEVYYRTKWSVIRMVL
jgi:hypothetical protein